MARECILCGDDESEHAETSPGERFLGHCLTQTLISPPSTLNPEGYFEPCDCPGYEPAPETEPAEA